MSLSPYANLVLLLLCFFGVSLTKSQNNFSVELIHNDSPRSPFYNPTETRFQRISNVVHHSLNRVKYVNQLLGVSHTNTPEITLTPMVEGYTISFTIGSPPLQIYGMLDMLSDMISFRCKPCNICLNQTLPIFDPSKSSTYKHIPCSSSTCKYVRRNNCSSRNCEYRIGQKSFYIQGDLSVDTLTLNSTNDTPISFPRVVIGCEHKYGVPPPLEGKVSGTIGLVGGPLSLVSQLSSSIGGKFSYCLVPQFFNSNTSSKLNFGNAVAVSGPGTVSIPILQLNPISVTLEAFSVGNTTIKLGHPSSKSSKQPNTVINAGLPITVLPKDVYSRLESAVESSIKLKRVNDPSQQFNLCYESTLKHLEVPIITAHFSGGDLQLKAINTFIQIDHKIVCFAFYSQETRNVFIGNLVQHNFLVGYDIQKKIVSFKPTDCTKQ